MAGFTTTPTQQPSLGVGGGPVPILRFWENNVGKAGGESSNDIYSNSYARLSVQMVNVPLALSFKNPQIVLIDGGFGAIDAPATVFACIGFYTKTGTSYTLYNSASVEFAPGFGNICGFVNLSVTSASLLTPGNYWVGVLLGSSTTHTSQNFTMSMFFNQTITNLTEAPPFFLRGSSTATRTDLPGSFVSTNFTLNNEAAWLQPYILITG